MKYYAMKDGSVMREADKAIIPPTEKNPDYVQYLADVVAGAVVEPFDEVAEAVRVAEAKAQQDIASIKAKAGQLILARLPDYKQRNYLARKAELQDILIAGGKLSTSEQAEWDFFAAEWAWAKAVRETSNAAEIAGTPVDEIVWPT